jgi:hypothetical protein
MHSVEICFRNCNETVSFSDDARFVTLCVRPAKARAVSRAKSLRMGQFSWTRRLDDFVCAATTVAEGRAVTEIVRNDVVAVQALPDDGAKVFGPR